MAYFKGEMISFIIWTFLFWSKKLTNAGTMQYNLQINSWDKKHELKHFWRSTGFCPPLPHERAYDFDYGSDMKQNLALIGSVAHDGIQQVRIHWLLDLVTVEVNDSGGLTYSYNKLIELLTFLEQYDLKPGFELMGSPSGFFTDFENKTQVYQWRDLIKDLASHLIEQYGIENVKTWNFETWNEPDCHDFGNVKMTVQGFLNYYDACSEGLNAASPLLKLGGPAAGCDHLGHNSYSNGLLQHVVDGQNYFTGEHGVRIDFLSYHCKGNGVSKNILNAEIKIFEQIVKKFPSLKDKPFYNDEADPMVGWSRNFLWRADATYAALVAKVISEHQNVIVSNSQSVISNYSLLSNDNAFLSWFPHQFTERTLTARFQINDTEPNYVQFIKKPVFSVMNLLSMLGEDQLTSTLTKTLSNGSTTPISDVDVVGVLPSLHYYFGYGSADSWQASVLIFSSKDTNIGESISINLSMGLDPPNPNGTVVVVIAYSINNNETTNPYLTWKNFGSPDFPSVSQFSVMRNAEEPRKIFNDTIISFNHYYNKSFTMQTPEVVLLHFCKKADAAPGIVTNLTLYNVTTGKVLITWSDDYVISKCILTYEIIFQQKYTRLLRRINDYDIISNSFYFTPTLEKDDFVEGTYFVRAVDYFSRSGLNSVAVKYGDFDDSSNKNIG